MLEKAYVRFKPFNDLPDNPNTYAAADGFSQLGVQIVPYRTVEQLLSHDINEETIVCGYIGDVWEALKKVGVDRPTELDYPSHLDWLMGRTVRRMPIEEVRRGTTRMFVKPTLQKLFTGLVWDPDDPRSRPRAVPVRHRVPGVRRRQLCL